MLSTPENNLKRWKESGEPEKWVGQRNLEWNHKDWLELLASLRRSEFWPMEESSVGAALGAIRDGILADRRRVAVVAETDAVPRSADVLLAVARPELYRLNAFRVLGLPVDASARDISKHFEMIEMGAKLGRLGGVKLGLLDMQPPPDTDVVRSAAHRLRDPELRLVDELFWFWPHELGAGKGDPALGAIARGDIAAAREQWLRQELAQSDASVSTHNMAVLFHAQALDVELKAETAALGAEERRQCEHFWREAISRWRILVGNDGFWKRVKARIRGLDDPRLSSELAERMRKGLPKALCTVNAKLAVQAAERGDAGEVERHKRVLAKWTEVAGDAAQEALRDALKPLRERINTLCRGMEERADADPKHADAVTWQLLEQARPMLQVVDRLLPSGDPQRDGAHDEAASRALACQIPFGNASEDWVTSEKLLEAVLDVAAGEAARNRVAQNLATVRRNKQLCTCYFCGRNPGEDAHGFTVPIHGNVRTEPIDYLGNSLEDLLAGRSPILSPLAGRGGTRTKWQHSEIKVPRCGECVGKQKRYSTVRNLFPWMGALFAIITVLFIALGPWQDYFNTGPAGLVVYLIVGVVAIFVIAINLGLGVGRVWARESKPPGELRSFPPLVERLAREGWSYGSGPGVAWVGPGKTNPERGKLGNWAPFRRLVLARPSLSVVLLLSILAVCGALLYCSIPVAGFAGGVPEATRDFYRHGLISGANAAELLTGRLRDEADPSVRRDVVEKLGELGPPAREAVPVLETATQDEDSDVREAASDALARVSPEDAVKTLVKNLKASQWQVRCGAAQMLGEMGPAARDAIPALKAATRDDDPNVQAAALDALVKLAPGDAVKPLVPKLNAGEPPERQIAAQMLGAIGPAAREAIPALQKATQDNDSNVQAAALEALVKVSPGDAIKPLVLKLYHASESPGREKAAQMLGSMGSAARDAIPALQEAAARDSNADVHAAAQDALVYVKATRQDAVKLLVEASNDSSWKMRQKAAQVLGEMGPAAREAIPALQKATGDADSDVQAAALEALVKVSPGEAVKLLVDRLNASESQVRQKAARILGEMRPAARDAIRALIKATHDDNSDVQAAALEALVKASPEDAIKPLVLKLNASEWQVRQKAAQMLGGMGSAAREAIPALQKAAQDSDSDVRAAAQEALDKIQGH